MGKVWFVTGANRGLGKEIALAALGNGDRVVACGRKAEAVEKEFAAMGAGERFLALALDVTEQDQSTEAVREAVLKFGRIDVLVNNAGYGQLGFFETLTPEQMERQYATNVFGTFNVTRAVLPQMRAQRSGHILNISSIGGAVGFGGCPAYTSSKFAMEGFSEDLAIELKPFGISVTIVEPGFMKTDFLDSSSVKYGDQVIDDYASAVAEQQAHYGDRNHQQLGDPKKFGQALLTVVAATDPPLGFAAGSDAVAMSRGALERRLAVLEQWRELSESTDGEG